MIVRDLKEFQIIFYICASILLLMGGLYVVQQELKKIEWKDRPAICAKRGMKYVYARMDICVDTNGQMWSMSELEKQ